MPHSCTGPSSQAAATDWCASGPKAAAATPTSRCTNGELGGGLGYSEERLRALWDKPPFSLRVLRQMNKTGGQGPSFGENFLWTLLATKD